MLKMKPGCQQCTARLGWQDDARICAFECTFCAACAQAMGHVCPNCSGELVARPKRTRKTTAVVAGLLRKRLGIARKSDGSATR